MLQGSSLPSLLPLLAPPSSPWLVATSPRSLPLSSRGHLSSVSSSLPVRTPVTGFPTQKTILSVLNLMTSAETQCPMSSHSQIAGLALVNMSLWGTLFNPVQTNSHDVSQTHFFKQPRALGSHTPPHPPHLPTPITRIELIKSTGEWTEAF